MGFPFLPGEDSEGDEIVHDSSLLSECFACRKGTEEVGVALRDGSVDLLRGAAGVEVAQILAVALGDLHNHMIPQVSSEVKKSERNSHHASMGVSNIGLWMGYVELDAGARSRYPKGSQTTIQP